MRGRSETLSERRESNPRHQLGRPSAVLLAVACRIYLYRGAENRSISISRRYLAVAAPVLAIGYSLATVGGRVPSGHHVQT